MGVRGWNRFLVSEIADITRISHHFEQGLFLLYTRDGLACIDWVKLGQKDTTNNAHV